MIAVVEVVMQMTLEGEGMRWGEALEERVSKKSLATSQMTTGQLLVDMVGIPACGNAFVPMDSETIFLGA